jgi:hypothetical protein
VTQHTDKKRQHKLQLYRIVSFTRQLFNKPTASNVFSYSEPDCGGSLVQTANPTKNRCWGANTGAASARWVTWDSTNPGASDCKREFASIQFFPVPAFYGNRLIAQNCRGECPEDCEDTQYPGECWNSEAENTGGVTFHGVYGFFSCER